MKILLFALAALPLMAQLKDAGSRSPVVGVGGTAVGLVTIAASATQNISAGSARIGSQVYPLVAASATLTGSTASSTIYNYVSNAGVLTCAHNGAATLTGTNCTVVTGVTTWPAGSIPISTVVYTSNVMGTITDFRGAVSREVILAGDGISVEEDSNGNTVVSATSVTPPVTLKSYLPLGPLPGNSNNATTVFTANETRWYLFTLLAPASFNTVGVYAGVGIGASKGIRAAVADTTGAILNTSAVQTTCANTTICLMTFSTVTLPAGQYYMGITTDSTTFTSLQARWPYETLDERMVRNTGTSIPTMGTGTAGSGTAGSVAFGASMGSLTKWTTAAESAAKLIESFVDTN